MDKISVTFPTSVYDRRLIDRAVQDYYGICTIELTGTADYTSCSFSRSVTDLEVTALEFSNYLIELANSQASV